ncbi:MAG: beta-lactamase family protein [Chitinophagaceae bacterium]|nr:beta-lactamase family protein [Chitinophagaceae bacterium]
MKVKTVVFILSVILLFFPACSFAQNDFSRLDNWLEKNTPDMGGRAVLLIWKDGKIIYSQEENEMSRRQKMVRRFIAKRQGKNADTNNFTTTSKQMIASCSKWLSAALVMTFADEGKLKLTDTVGRYLPVLSANGKGHITISQCLSHLTGIKAPPLKESIGEMKEVSSMDEAMDKIAELPMEAEPGKVFRYSNTGLQIAGAVLEKISGKSFEQLFAERIARPLDMKNTDFGKGKVALPAGGAYSTPEDYMHFVEMILNKGMYNGKRILSENSVMEMQVNRVAKDVRVAYSPDEAGDFGYGFGEWVMETSSTTNISTAVTSPGLFGSFPWVDNEKQYCAFLMCFYIKNKGRNERYKELKLLVDEAIANQ